MIRNSDVIRQNTEAALQSTWPDWKIESLIGAGSYGCVYRICRILGQRRIYGALKVIMIEDNTGQNGGSYNGTPYLPSRPMVERAIEEIQIMESLKGVPNIVHIEDSLNGKVLFSHAGIAESWLKRHGNILPGEGFRPERLNEMLRKGEVHKTYWALTAGKPPKTSDTLTDYLTRNEAQNKSYVSKNGKEARLKYTLIQSTDRYYLLEVALSTGRHHQIRCQLAHMGCPIKGDLKYGAKRSNPDGGICLLARRIQFIHPVKKTEVDVTAPVPDSWKGVQG